MSQSPTHRPTVILGLVMERDPRGAAQGGWLFANSGSSICLDASSKPRENLQVRHRLGAKLFVRQVPCVLVQQSSPTQKNDEYTGWETKKQCGFLFASTKIGKP